MARFLVSLAYRGKEYATLITALDKKNAVEFGANKCIDVASKATGLTFGKILWDINEYIDAHDAIPFDVEIVH